MGREKQRCPEAQQDALVLLVELPFAKAVGQAARTILKRRGCSLEVFGDDKVFISAAFDELKKFNRALVLCEFKADLVACQRSGELDLSRADLVEAMPAEAVARSETWRDGSSFHFIRVQVEGRRW